MNQLDAILEALPPGMRLVTPEPRVHQVEIEWCPACGATNDKRHPVLDRSCRRCLLRSKWWPGVEQMRNSREALARLEKWADGDPARHVTLVRAGGRGGARVVDGDTQGEGVGESRRPALGGAVRGVE